MMDRRQERTREALFSALNRLLEKKHFAELSVQELLDEANIGRSTFYAHFRTKEDVARQLCAELLGHIFASAPKVGGHPHRACTACFAQGVCQAHNSRVLSVHSATSSVISRIIRRVWPFSLPRRGARSLFASSAVT